MSQQIQDIWKQFDALIEKATTDDTKLLIEALKLNAQLLNLRMGGIEQAIHVGSVKIAGK